MGVDDLLADKVKRSHRSPSEIAAAARGGSVVPIHPPAGGQAAASPVIPLEEAATPGKKADPLPLPGEPYRASARFINRLQEEQKILHFVLKDGTIEGFFYSDLRRVSWVPGDKPGASPVLSLKFVEAQVTDVEIRGRHLKDIHYFISIGVLPWVWELPGKDFEAEGVPVITRIAIG